MKEESTPPSNRGRLKVFFGMSAGVGKTYAMLEEARRRAAEGLDVLVGYAEPHIRPETEVLLLGLEILPHKLVEYRGSKLREFDLDAALARRPAVVCVDELAHTNAPGSRHEKRWQDIEELLSAGINVYSTLNVQHLESVNDVVQRITGVAVRETLPDAVLERADEVELIDVSPEELLERLREGKIYRPEQAERATKQFFNSGNLLALRELALRTVAQRVDAQMTEVRRTRGAKDPWAATERVLVCVSPAPTSARLVRSAKRLAVSLRADLVAATVELPGQPPLSDRDRHRLERHFRLAEQLGGRSVTLSGTDTAEALLLFARENNVTKIVVGKPSDIRQPWWHRLPGLNPTSLTDELIRRSGPIDVYAIQGERDPSLDEAPDRPAASSISHDLPGYFAALATTALVSALGWPLLHVWNFANPNVLMLYLLSVVFIAMRHSRGAAVLASVLSVAAFDYLFVLPYYTFAVSDQQYLLTFAVMLVTALTISALTHRIRAQADQARFRERQTAVQGALARELAAARTAEDIAAATLRNLTSVFHCPACLLIPRAGQLVPLGGTPPLDDRDAGVARWAFDNAKAAGLGTATLPSASALFLPIIAPRGTVGVLGLHAPVDRLTTEARQLLEALALQTAVALERATLESEAREAWERVEAEFLRNTLLSGVSHELRTPLAAISGAASTLQSDNGHLDPATRTQLLDSISDESARMNRLITNLLDMTRLESGGLKLSPEWLPLADLLEPALRQLHHRLGNRPINVSIPHDLPFVYADPAALERVLVNLLDNAAEYTPPGTSIDISAALKSPSELTLAIADHGPGIPPGTESRVFDRFFRAPSSVAAEGGQPRGVGLGLAIARAITHAHHGTITARNRPAPQTGAIFTLTLPLPADVPPSLPPEPAR
jgi:two-component system sensor histidine kinase KdpD